MTSARPGCMNGSARRSARRSSRAAAAVTSCTSVDRHARPGRWRRGRTPAGRAPCAATVVTVPATPTTDAACADRDRRGAVEGGVDVGRRRPRPPRRSAGRSAGAARCIRTEPMSMRVPRRVGRGRVAEDQLGGAAADVDDQHRRGRRRRAGRGWRRRRTARPPRCPATTSGPTPSRSRTPAANTSPLLASRVAEVAQKRIRSTRVRGDERGVLVDRGERALQRLVGEPAGAVDALAEPDHPDLALEHRDRRGEVGDQQLDRVGAAVDRGDPVMTLDRSRLTQGPAAHQSPSRSSTSSPSGFTPRPWASAWPASTCRHLTRSGMPPAEMPAISGDLADRGPGGEVGLVRGARTPPPGSGSVAEPVLHLPHQPGRLEGADREAARGQVR